MHNLSILELGRMLRAKKFSSVELVQHFLNRIKQFDQQINSFITLNAEQALTQAKIADQQLTKDNPCLLQGIPIAHKDLFCTKDVLTTCASKMLANFTSPYDATLVANLANAGAISIGKLNMDEFAMGSTNETSYFGAVHNPWDLTRVPGGSSGGSAASVAAKLITAATASDTGGSIRQPAALCNLTGIKPTYGRVSRWGMIAFASSLDQAGVIAHSAEDCAILLAQMAGFDAKDSTSANVVVDDYLSMLSRPLNGLNIGIVPEFLDSKLNPNIANAVTAVAKQLTELGANLLEVKLPNCKYAIEAYYVIAPAEASSNLARFDGVRYGYRCANPIDLDDMYKRSRSEGFGAEVKRRIMIGTYALSAGFYDAYYVKAQKVRRLIKQDFVNAFNQVDAILAPTTTDLAHKIGDTATDPLNAYLEDIYTSTANLAGIPALSMPAGFADNLPIGVQLIGNYFQEGTILNIAHQYQQATNWHLQTAEGF